MDQLNIQVLLIQFSVQNMSYLPLLLELIKNGIANIALNTIGPPKL